MLTVFGVVLALHSLPGRVVAISPGGVTGVRNPDGVILPVLQDARPSLLEQWQPGPLAPGTAPAVPTTDAGNRGTAPPEGKKLKGGAATVLEASAKGAAEGRKCVPISSTPTGEEVAACAAIVPKDGLCLRGSEDLGEPAETHPPAEMTCQLQGQDRPSSMTFKDVAIWLAPLLVVLLGVSVAVAVKQMRRRELVRQERRVQETVHFVPVPHEALLERHRTTVCALPPAQQEPFHERSVPRLCALLADTSPLAPMDVPHEHAWAAAPQTLGCLAGMHLASLAGEDPYGCAVEVLDGGGLPTLTGFLGETEDRQHCALIVLALLSYHEDVAATLAQLGFEERLAAVRTESHGLFPHTTVAIILRYMFYYSEPAKTRFVQTHGLSIFTDLLEAQQAPLQVTAVANLLDILNGPDGITQEVLLVLRAQGPEICPRLEALGKSGVENAAHLLELLNDDSLVDEGAY